MRRGASAPTPTFPDSASADTQFGAPAYDLGLDARTLSEFYFPSPPTRSRHLVRHGVIVFFYPADAKPASDIGGQEHHEELQDHRASEGDDRNAWEGWDESVELAQARAKTAYADRHEFALLAVEGVTIRFGGVTALENVSFRVARGVICGLIGPNGAGKTTLFNCISRLYEPHSGSIAFDGKPLGNFSPACRSRASESRAPSRTSRCSPR